LIQLDVITGLKSGHYLHGNYGQTARMAQVAQSTSRYRCLGELELPSAGLSDATGFEILTKLFNDITGILQTEMTRFVAFDSSQQSSCI
jgi:hypothetical protein